MFDPPIAPHPIPLSSGGEGKGEKKKAMDFNDP
jgi:hypothetical protein